MIPVNVNKIVTCANCKYGVRFIPSYGLDRTHGDFQRVICRFDPLNEVLIGTVEKADSLSCENVVKGFGEFK